MKGLNQMKKQKIDKELSLKSYNESRIICEQDTDSEKDLYDRISELAIRRAQRDFIKKMNTQDLTNLILSSIKKHNLDISQIENTLYDLKFTPGQVEGILDIVRTNLEESLNTLPLNQVVEFTKPYFIEGYSKFLGVDEETQQLLDKGYAKIYPDNKICYRKGQKVIMEQIPTVPFIDKVKVTFLTPDGKKDMSIIEYFDDSDAEYFRPVINENSQTFALAKKFNSPEEFKQDLEKARKEYKVVDQMEGKDLLHLVYKNGEHIATYNNTKLEKYIESLNEKNIEFEDIKKLNEEIENFLQNT